MGLSLVTPNAVPARTYDRYGILSLELSVRPDGTLDAAVIAQQATATDWSSDPATKLYLREPDLVAAVGRSADPATAAGNLQSVTSGLLYLLGVLLAEQNPGLVQFPPEAEA